MNPRQPNHPTPPPSGRTAEEILDDLTFEVIKWQYGVVSAEVKAELHKASRQLFDAMMEIVGEDEIGEWTGKYSINSVDFAKRHGEPTPQNILIGGRNLLRTKLRQRLRVFFGQDGESKNGN